MGLHVRIKTVLPSTPLMARPNLNPAPTMRHRRWTEGKAVDLGRCHRAIEQWGRPRQARSQTTYGKEPLRGRAIDRRLPTRDRRGKGEGKEAAGEQ